MANYSDIRGYRVKYLSSDPTLSTSNEGQVWYNSTSGTLKSLVQLKAWSSSGAMTTARRGGAGAGIQTQGLAFGGASFTVPTTFNNTEEYSGYIWTTGGNMNTARGFLGGSGTQTAGLAFGGTPGSPNQAQVTTATEEYNGSTWASNPTGLNTTRRLLAGFGTQTATIAFGGDDASPGFLTNTESYNGSTWTSSPGSLVSGIETGSNAGAGIQTAGITAGTNSTSLLTQTWNGSAWASGPNLNNNQGGNTNLVGTQTSSLVFGGSSSLPSEQWDGSTWTSTPALGTQRRNTLGFGIATLGLAGGGLNPSNTMVTTTEEYNSTIFSPATGAWASGGNMANVRRTLGGAGTQTAGLAAGGLNTPPISNSTEEYDGSAWAAGGNLGTASYYGSATGLQTAALYLNGILTVGSAPYGSVGTQEYDGSTWSPGGNLNTAGWNRQSFGIQTAAIAAVGTSTGPPFNRLTNVESYNGTSWTSVNSASTARTGVGATGVQTAGLIAGGRIQPGPATNVTEEWDGTNWTSGGNINTSRTLINGGFGSQTSAVIAGGDTANPFGTVSALTELYDGTAWSSAPPISTARFSACYSQGQTANSSLGFIAGGTAATANTAATEEWTGTPSTGTASTLTTS